VLTLGIDYWEDVQDFGVSMFMCELQQSGDKHGVGQMWIAQASLQH
jgi:hypothetical protein